MAFFTPSRIYEKHALYRLMLKNIRDQIASQNPLDQNQTQNFNIFEVTAVIGMSVGLPPGTVMSDYLIGCLDEPSRVVYTK